MIHFSNDYGFQEVILVKQHSEELCNWTFQEVHAGGGRSTKDFMFVYGINGCNLSWLYSPFSIWLCQPLMKLFTIHLGCSELWPFYCPGFSHICALINECQHHPNKSWYFEFLMIQVACTHTYMRCKWSLVSSHCVNSSCPSYSISLMSD